jgi:hypothetical protein
VYEETYTDGTIKTTTGNRIYGVTTSGMINGTQKQRNEATLAYHPELLPVIEAAAVLNDSLTQACLSLDAQRGCGEYKFA